MNIKEDNTSYYYDGIGGMYVLDKDNTILKHTQRRIDDALAKAKDIHHFENLMLGRLKKIKNHFKIVVALVLLDSQGYHELALKYESMLFLS